MQRSLRTQASNAVGAGGSTLRRRDPKAPSARRRLAVACSAHGMQQYVEVAHELADAAAAVTLKVRLRQYRQWLQLLVFSVERLILIGFIVAQYFRTPIAVDVKSDQSPVTVITAQSSVCPSILTLVGAATSSVHHMPVFLYYSW